MKKHKCKDCKAEGRQGPVLNVVDGVPGPRCFRHAQAWKRKRLEKKAAGRRAMIYGLTPEQYEAILEVQGHRCGWCERPMRKGGRRLAVDHDHTCCAGRVSCGKCVRGLLCWSCNKHLQHLDDNPVLVLRGLNYLENPPARLALVTTDQ